MGFNLIRLGQKSKKWYQDLHTIESWHTSTSVPYVLFSIVQHHLVYHSVSLAGTDKCTGIRLNRCQFSSPSNLTGTNFLSEVRITISFQWIRNWKFYFSIMEFEFKLIKYGINNAIKHWVNIVIIASGDGSSGRCWKALSLKRRQILIRLMRYSDIRNW